jgi:hypothetical protein
MKRWSQSGQVLPLIAISLAVLLGFAGLAVDVGYLEYQLQQQQTATDAAALGGAQALAHSNCGSASAAESAAQTDAFENGYASGVSPVSPPSSGPYASNDCAITVQIQTQHVTNFFSKLFGYPTGMTESTQATALASTTGGACIYLLSTSSWSSFNSATVSSPGCAIAINYSADFDGGTIAAPSIGYVSPPNYGGTTFTLATPAPMLPVADPCPEIPGCAYLAANPQPTASCQSVNTNGQPTTLYPGCYSNLNLDTPGAVTMKPGVYVINGNFNDNGVPLTGSGVTIYTTANGSGPNFDSNGTVSLSPPTPPANTAGVLYYQVPSNSSGIDFNGPNVSMSGLIYSPSTTSANFNSNGGGYVVLVFGSMNFNGNTANDYATPPPGQSLIKKAVLVQ